MKSEFQTTLGFIKKKRPEEAGAWTNSRSQTYANLCGIIQSNDSYSQACRKCLVLISLVNRTYSKILYITCTYSYINIPTSINVATISDTHTHTNKYRCIKRTTQTGTKNTNLAGGFNPIEKYSSKWVHLPQIGVEIKNICNHHPATKRGSQHKKLWTQPPKRPQGDRSFPPRQHWGCRDVQAHSLRRREIGWMSREGLEVRISKSTSYLEIPWFLGYDNLYFMCDWYLDVPGT